MKLEIKGLTTRELSTMGNYLKTDLTFNPQDPNERVEILKSILLELEDRGEVDRLAAAAAHKSLQIGDYKNISIFKFLPNDKKINNVEVSIFLRIKMKDFKQVENFLTQQKVKN